MKITIDYNSDRIYINPDERYENIECEFNKTDIKNPIFFIQKLLEEIFKRLDDTRLSSATPYFDIELEKLDEDTRSTIGEW